MKHQCLPDEGELNTRIKELQKRIDDGYISSDYSTGFTTRTKDANDALKEKLKSSEKSEKKILPENQKVLFED